MPGLRDGCDPNLLFLVDLLAVKRSETCGLPFVSRHKCVRWSDWRRLAMQEARQLTPKSCFRCVPKRIFATAAIEVAGDVWSYPE